MVSGHSHSGYLCLSKLEKNIDAAEMQGTLFSSPYDSQIDYVVM